MDTTFNWIKDNGTLINLGLTLVLVLITGIYVYLTHRLVHTPYKVNMRIRFYLKSLIYEEINHIAFYNFGPGKAINIIIKFSTSGGNILYEYFPEVKPSEETDIKLKASLSNYPLYIKWNSVTGKSQKIVYVMKNGRMTQIGYIERFYYFVKQILSFKKNPKRIKPVHTEQEDLSNKN